MVARVFEEVDSGPVRILAIGVAVFVTDGFVREVKTPPLSWIGPELARRVAVSDSPVLSDREVREANSTDGLNLIVWEAEPPSPTDIRPEVLHLIASDFVRCLRGFQLKEMIAARVANLASTRWALDAGGFFWDAASQRYVRSPGRPIEELCREPHVIGITRELEFEQPGSRIGSLFYSERATFGLTRSEQELLLAALETDSGTDQELARVLHLSVSVVKKNWLSIYRRVASAQPELIPGAVAEGDVPRRPPTERGKEKRRRLLAYLREHPEELRPVAKKLLPSARSQR